MQIPRRLKPTAPSRNSKPIALILLLAALAGAILLYVWDSGTPDGKLGPSPSDPGASPADDREVVIDDPGLRSVEQVIDYLVVASDGLSAKVWINGHSWSFHEPFHFGAFVDPEANSTITERFTATAEQGTLRQWLRNHKDAWIFILPGRQTSLDQLWVVLDGCERFAIPYFLERVDTSSDFLVLKAVRRVPRQRGPAEGTMVQPVPTPPNPIGSAESPSPGSIR